MYTKDMARLTNFRIWDYLSTLGMKCVVADVPMSLPTFDTLADVRSVCHTGISESFWRGGNYEALPKEKQGIAIETLDKLPKSFDTGYSREINVQDRMTVDMKRREYARIVEEEEADVFFFGFHELDPASHLFGLDSGPTQDIINEMNVLLEVFMDYPVLIVSDHGFETFPKRLNVDAFLTGRGLFFYDEDGADFSKSKAYPVDCNVHEVSTQEWGIYINTKDKAQGFVTDSEAQDIMTELITQLNDIDGITALPKWLYYDAKAEFYHEGPDILLKSEDNSVFIRSTFTSSNIIDPFGRGTHSIKAILAANFKSDIQKVGSLEEVYTFICQILEVKDEKLEGTILADTDKETDKAVSDRLKELGYLE
jgi:predicted AlkP superfamily phosphohydrolase/phosphomutase